MFSPNTDSLGCQPFKGASCALVLGLPLRDTIKGLLLVLGPFLIPTVGLVSCVCTPIISNPISRKSVLLFLSFIISQKMGNDLNRNL